MRRSGHPVPGPVLQHTNRLFKRRNSNFACPRCLHTTSGVFYHLFRRSCEVHRYDMGIVCFAEYS